MDSTLENIVAHYLGLSAVSRIGVYAEDVGSGEKLFELNSRQVFRSASTIKLAIAYEVMRRVDAGLLRLEDDVKIERSRFVGGSGLMRLMAGNLKPNVECMLQLMLTVSDNSASNILVDLVGKSSVNNSMRELGLKGTILAGKFMYTRKKRFNSTTPADMVRLISAIYRGRGLSAKSARRLIRILSFQQHTGLIPSSLPGWWVKTINKPGALSDLRADVAVVWDEDWAYSVAIFVEGFKDAYMGERCVREISRGVFDAFLAERGGAERGAVGGDGVCP